jgi:hypothetical protein
MIQIAKKPERLGLREMQGISVVAKASSAKDFFASFFGLSKKEENEAFPHSTLLLMQNLPADFSFRGSTIGCLTSTRYF